MNKWADYLISAVRYSKQRQEYITYAKVHHDKANHIGKGYTWSRDEIIAALISGKSLMTIYRKDTGDWKKGSVVNLIRHNDSIIITDSERSNSDHLSGLQEL